MNIFSHFVRTRSVRNAGKYEDVKAAMPGGILTRENEFWDYVLKTARKNASKGIGLKNVERIALERVGEYVKETHLDITPIVDYIDSVFNDPREKEYFIRWLYDILWERKTTDVVMFLCGHPGHFIDFLGTILGHHYTDYTNTSVRGKLLVHIKTDPDTDVKDVIFCEGREINWVVSSANMIKMSARDRFFVKNFGLPGKNAIDLMKSPDAVMPFVRWVRENTKAPRSWWVPNTVDKLPFVEEGYEPLVYDWVRRQFASGAFPPGCVIKQKEFVDMYNAEYPERAVTDRAFGRVLRTLGVEIVGVMPAKFKVPNVII